MAVCHYTCTRVSCWSDLGRLAETKVYYESLLSTSSSDWIQDPKDSLIPRGSVPLDVAVSESGTAAIISR